MKKIILKNASKFNFWIVLNRKESDFPQFTPALKKKHNEMINHKSIQDKLMDTLMKA